MSTKLASIRTGTYCGCCSGPVSTRSLICAKCVPHLAPRGRGQIWDRTWFAQFGTDCPNQYAPQGGVK